jgi:DNA polymerase-3 subunit chi
VPLRAAVTDVEFHTGVADRVGFACRLLRKACRSGARVLVTAPAEVLAELDRSLWTFDEREFLPHVRVPGPAAAVRRRTPIWLAGAAPLTDDAAAGPAPRVLVNLGAAAPADLQAFERLIEVLSTDAADVDSGRARWRAYKAAGLNIVHHAGS